MFVLVKGSSFKEVLGSSLPKEFGDGDGFDDVLQTVVVLLRLGVVLLVVLPPVRPVPELGSTVMTNVGLWKQIP